MDTKKVCYDVRNFNSKDEMLHYRIVYELMRDIALLQDRVKELEGEKVCGREGYCPICRERIVDCEHGRLAMVAVLLDYVDKREDK